MNKTGKTAIISIYPGIGDIIWHLPFFTALAKTAAKKKIHLFTIKTTLAKEILKYDEIIDKIHYLNETREFFNTIKFRSRCLLAKFEILSGEVITS